MVDFENFGSWLIIDPDFKTIQIIEKKINLEILCELLRCDATEINHLGQDYLGYVDGEGKLQERQTEWKFDTIIFYGPMLIFKMGKDDMDMISCNEKDLQFFKEKVIF